MRISPAYKGWWSFIDVALSPDGTRIAYKSLTSFGGSWSDIYVARADGSGMQQVSRMAGNIEGPPSWLPDGNDIAYNVFGYDGTQGTYHQRAEAGSPARLTRALSGQSCYPGDCPSKYWSEGEPVAVSVDGRSAVAAQDRVYVFPVIGEFPERTVQTATAGSDAGHPVIGLAWSPDGKRLAFIQLTMGQTALNVVDMATGGVTTIATMPNGDWQQSGGVGRDYSACWLPSGNAIAFAVPDGNFTGHIFIVPAAGGTVVPFTTAPGVSDRSVSCAR